MRGCLLFMVVFAVPFFGSIIDSHRSRGFQANAAKTRDQHQAVVRGDVNTIRGHLTNDKKKKSISKVRGTKKDSNVVRDKFLPGYFNSTIKKFPPEFKHPSKMYNMDMKPAGSFARLRCTAVGNPMPNITWFKNNGVIERNPNIAPKYSKWSMMLDDISKTDSGDYTCLVCNELSCIDHTTKLLVQERYPSKPFIKEGYPGNVTAVVNDTITLSCPPISDLEPYLYWLKTYDNFTVKDGEVEPNATTIPDGYEIQSDDVTDPPEVLTLANVNHEDQGWYVCVALNTLGRVIAGGYLTVLDSPPEKQHYQDGYSNLSVFAMISFITIVLISITIISITMKKLTQEKRRKLLAVETMRVMMEKHCAKIVRVEYNTYNNGTDTMITPNVSIDKVKHCELPQEISKPSLSSEYILPADTKWEVAKESLSLGKVLGEGEFGKVFKAQCTRTPNTSLPCAVAVKMLKEGHSDTDMIALVLEMEIMKLVGKHENIINLLGCCTQDGPLYLIMEYAHNGCLRDYLKRYRPHKNNASTENLLKKTLTQRELTDFVCQVAKGMAYLSSRGCIHRDLAARNVLVSADVVLKVADFGLARDVRDSDYYRKRTAGKLPVRWMAPESLCRNYYTAKTDIWSFGILAWEIMTFGCTPYRNVRLDCLFEYIKSGKRLERPDDCSKDMYSIMTQCWTFCPDDRPQFADLVESLQKTLQ